MEGVAGRCIELDARAHDAAFDSLAARDGLFHERL